MRFDPGDRWDYGINNAVMMRRQGRTKSECDGVGFGTMPFAGQRRDRSQGEVARGLDFNLFATGGDY